MAKYLNLRIAAAVGERLKPHAEALEWTPNKFAEKCVQIVLDMIEDPSKRVLPEVVAMLDARAKVIVEAKQLGESKHEPGGRGAPMAVIVGAGASRKRA